MPEETISTPATPAALMHPVDPGAPAAVPAAAPAVPVAPPAVLGADGQPFDPERAMATINKLRASEKTGQAVEKTLDAIRRALGVKTDLPTEPAELQKALEDERAGRATDKAAFNQLKVDHALAQAITKHGANADTLAPFMRGSHLIEGLDAAAEGFEKDLAAIVKSTVDKFPQFKAAQTAVVSGAPFPAGSGGTQNLITQADLKTMSNAQINEARRTGKLEHLGIGSGK